MLKELVASQLEQHKKLEFGHQAKFIFKELFAKQASDKLQNLDFGIEPNLIQLDQSLFMFDLTLGQTGSYHDCVTRLFVEHVGTKVHFTMCPDIAVSLSKIDNLLVVLILNLPINAQLRRLQVSTVSNIVVIGVRDATHDLDQILKENGYLLVENQESYQIMQFSWVWFASIKQPNIDMTMFLPDFCGAKIIEELATKFDLPIKFAVAKHIDSIENSINEVYDTYGLVVSPECAQLFDYYNNFVSKTPTICVIVATQNPFKYTETVLSALGKTATLNAQQNIRRLSNLTALDIPQDFVRAANATPRLSIELNQDRLLKKLNTLKLQYGEYI